MTFKEGKLLTSQANKVAPDSPHKHQLTQASPGVLAVYPPAHFILTLPEVSKFCQLMACFTLYNCDVFL